MNLFFSLPIAAKLKDLLPNLHKGSNKKKNNEEEEQEKKEKNSGNFRVRDAEKLIVFMDKNGDGELQTGEFIEAIMRNILQSKKSTCCIRSRASLSLFLQSCITMFLVYFLSVHFLFILFLFFITGTRSQLKKAKLSKALEGMITVLRTEVQRRVLVEASRVLFRRYDFLLHFYCFDCVLL